MKKKTFRIFVFFCVGVLLCILLVSSPIFLVKQIQIVGNQLVPTAEIQKRFPYQNVNIFSVNKKAIQKTLTENPYIQDAHLIKKYPNRVTLEIKERKPSGYVKNLDDSYLYIDENGFVLEVLGDLKDNLPIIEGLEFTNFAVGKQLENQKNIPFRSILNISRLVHQYIVSDKVVKLDVHDLSDIRLYINNMEIRFGSLEEAEYKVKCIKEIVAQMPNAEEVKAIINLQTNIIEFVM